MYYFKSQKKVLQFQTSTGKCKILNSHLTEIENLNPNISKLRTGVFDNQGYSPGLGRGLPMTVLL